MNDKQENFVTQIGESGKLLLSLINNLLDLSRIDAGKLTLKSESIAINSFMDALKDLIRHQMVKKDLHFEINIENNLTTVYGDREKIRQVILNLLSNAIKFTPHGGAIQLNVITVDPRFIRFDVQDSGLGIDVEEQEHIFTEFQNRRQMWYDDIGRPGIRLALTQRLVEMHGGAIGVKSVKGVGSTFWFTIPCEMRHSFAIL
jgi:signal transduction histidine kinase